MIRRTPLFFAVFAALIAVSSAFVQPTNLVSSRRTGQSSTCCDPSLSAVAPMSAADIVLSNELPSAVISAATVDPTSFLSSVLGGILGSPVIILIPVLAAFGVASLLAASIVWYANPADEDED
eukprot:CAMPEP_0181043524 /NCGR_PEP_ID=MMETSP1070-20121207/12761_1 /TAXON_ID=265543 /ORGANISM="Minutocellus polymorphus, Strain NH13" /LENGTH=122 /DNA_ID=CAMNT_0023121873 /DNA_START=69 /DNA_END=437 /DNA_ORIENTATION=+